MGTKTCTKCKTEYPKTDEYFYNGKRNNGEHRLSSRCKKCLRPVHKQIQRDKLITGQPQKASYKWWLNNKEKSYKQQQKYKYQYKGVYGLFENGVCLYVGESKRINVRKNEHFTCLNNIENAPDGVKYLYKKLQKHNYVIFGILEETDNHKEREQYYINKLKPLYNVKR